MAAEQIELTPVGLIQKNLEDLDLRWSANQDAHYTNQDTQERDQHPEERYNKYRAAWFGAILYWLEEGARYADPVKQQELQARINELHVEVSRQNMLEQKIHPEEIEKAEGLIQDIQKIMAEIEPERGAA